MRRPWTASGAHLLWRVKSNQRFPVRESFPDGSWRSVLRGSGRDRKRTRGACTVRAFSYRLAGSDECFTLVTTLLDPAAAPAAELAALYHERWEIKTACDEVKTHLLGPGAQLRSKTPDLVMQEFDGLTLAHYAVRYLIQEAADLAGEDPDQLSFLHAVNVIRRRIVHPGGFPPMPAAPTPDASLLDEILEERALSSRGQVKPRGVRRKMSNYPLRTHGPLSRKVHRWVPEIQPVRPKITVLRIAAFTLRRDAR